MPSLADVLAEREPAREARRLLTYVTIASRRPPLDSDVVFAMTLRAHAEAVVAWIRVALECSCAASAEKAAEEALRALLSLRAVMLVALDEGLLHRAQFEILENQTAKTRRAVEEVFARARWLGRWPVAAARTGGVGEPPTRPAARTAR